MTAFSSLAAEKVSFVSLLSSPDKYDGKCVQTVGVISVEFERGSLYLDQGSYIARAYENGISQPFEAEQVAYKSENAEVHIQKLADAYEGKLVRVVGKFKASNPSKRLNSTKSKFSSISYVRALAPNEGASFGNQARCL
ncbi:hypothetical protein PRUB_a0672 [Pseudoalteromonas rubra]|uniref:Uncharacterized protein n=2 Tax=Pseudoalteromonas rubra TaxID=43658 RepID=A0A8T0C6D4_9GAMM|nr:hypothetical protein PRUB_a0672 [Pseudoalteromonas rubra]